MVKRTSSRAIIMDFASPEPGVPFPPAEYRARLDKVRKAMTASKIDLLFVASPESLYYLSGYQALWYQAQVLEHWVPISGIAVRVDEDDYIQFESDAETNLCKYSTISRDLRILRRHDTTLLDFIVQELKKEGWAKGTMGLEMFAYRPPRAVSEAFQAKMESAGVRKTVDATHVVNGVRHIKSPQEMAFTRTAARISEIGMGAAQKAIRPGVTELEVWGEVMCAMAKAGGENPSITLPVDSGPKSAIPHSMPSRRVMCAGDVVNVDVCAVYNRYHSDCARTFSIGEPHPDVAATVAKSAKSFQVLKNAARPGAKVQSVCNALKAYYKEAGLWGEQWWTGGYELGCAFPPDWVGPWSYDAEVDNGDKTFVDGMIVNYESDFYLPRAAGVSLLIETLLFDGGQVEFAHRIPHDLIVVE